MAAATCMRANGVFNAVDSYSKNQGGSPLSDQFYYPGGDVGGPVLIPKTGLQPESRQAVLLHRLRVHEAAAGG